MRLVTFITLLLLGFAATGNVVVDKPPADLLPDTPTVPAEILKLTLVEGAEPPVVVDGQLDEAIWAEIPAYDEFVVLDPDTLERGVYATLVRFLYTDRGLYVGIDMEQPKETLVRRLSGRDARRLNRDGVSLTIDTSGEGRYGYWFGINLGNALTDGTVLPERQFSSRWDGPWRGASAETATGWSAEYFIPWGTVAMPLAGETRRMGVYLSRKVAFLDERWGWPALPGTQPFFMSALQQVELKGIAPKQQYNIYPFSSVTIDQIDADTDYQVGADLFWRPSSNFQVNATLNPDFGSVESDDVVVNFSATETFFPEKRLFFLEGQDVFVATPRADASRGGGTMLLNTRRIGGKPRAPDALPGTSILARERNQPVDLVGAAKFTGQIGQVRYGVLGAFEDDVSFDATLNGSAIDLSQEGSDYGAVRLLYEDNEGSAYRAIGVLSTLVSHDLGDAATHGVDYHYLTESGKLKMDGQMFMSSLDDADDGYGGFVDLEYTLRQGVRQKLRVDYYDRDVDINDLGFLGRNDMLELRTSHSRRTSDLLWARTNAFDVSAWWRQNNDQRFLGGGVWMGNNTTFDNLTRLSVRGGWNAERFEDRDSFGNGLYRVEQRRDFAIDFDSDSSRPLSYEFGVQYFEEGLGGDSFRYKGGVSWRPTDQFNFSARVVYRDRNGWLLHQENGNFTTFDAEQWEPRVNFEYFLSAKQQFRLSLQWVAIKATEDAFYVVPNSPGDLIPVGRPPGPPDDFAVSDMVFQARYRWEIAPLSDVFIVYTRAGDVGHNMADAGFGDLFSEAWNQPIGDQLVMKIRYRFGS